MPRYDVRCRACGDTFEITRSMAELDQPAACPAGHTDTVRLLNTVAVTRAGGSSSAGGLGGAPRGGGQSSGSQSSGSQSSGGGCCGGGCCG